jgi:antitoxin (DNA-binding transcriptional repressor) of toxin-antitoxin stability system
MTTITIEKAQQELPELVKRALEGEEIVIQADDALAVKLAPVPQDQSRRESYRGRGVLKGKLVVGPEFFEPLPEDELKLWEKRGDE